jgi:hypothetical protein
MQYRNRNITGYLHYHNSSDIIHVFSIKLWSISWIISNTEWNRNCIWAFPHTNNKIFTSWKCLKFLYMVEYFVNTFLVLQFIIVLREQIAQYILTCLKPTTTKHEMDHLNTNHFIQRAYYGIPYVTSSVWDPSAHASSNRYPLFITRNYPNAIPPTHLLSVHLAFSQETRCSAQMKEDWIITVCGTRHSCGLVFPWPLQPTIIYRLHEVQRRV